MEGQDIGALRLKRMVPRGWSKIRYALDHLDERHRDPTESAGLVGGRGYIHPMMMMLCYYDCLAFQVALFLSKLMGLQSSRKILSLWRVGARCLIMVYARCSRIPCFSHQVSVRDHSWHEAH